MRSSTSAASSSARLSEWIIDGVSGSPCASTGSEPSMCAPMPMAHTSFAQSGRIANSFRTADTDARHQSRAFCYTQWGAGVYVG